MISKHKWKTVGTGLRLVWKMDKWLLIFSIMISIIESVTPFIGILLSAYILDGLASGAESGKIVPVSLATVAAIFLLTVLKDYLKRN